MTDFDPLSADSYRFWTVEHVRFADLDLLGHVNNKAYATYFETARVDFGRACGLSDTAQKSMALVRLEIDYRKEIRYPATLRLGVRLRRLGNSSLTLAAAVFDGEICASTAQTIGVRFDGVARKSCPFTDIERQALEAYL
jgi:acyl-CoA thioester hydrolase